MNLMFKPKHQKLILQCYPPKKLSVNGESKPNKSKLSYLVYYASTRRTKLEKVGSFLTKKTRSDASRGRIGNLKVTLYILLELVDKCTDDLGILAPSILDILRMILTVRDLSTCQLASDLFVNFCRGLQPIERQVFSSNYNLLKQFLKVTCTFLEFGREPKPRAIGSRSQSTNSVSTALSHDDWLRIALHTTSCVAEYIGPNFSVLEGIDLIDISIQLLLETINKHSAELDIMRGIPEESAAAMAATTATAATDSAASGTAAAPPEIVSDAEESIGDLALNSLKEFFNTGSKRRVDSSTKALIKYALSNRVDINWINRLVTICAKKTHIELRYRIVATMMVELNSNDTELKIFLCDMISNVLSSEDVNLVGLPVKDVLSSILVNEKNLVRSYIDKSSHPLSKQLGDSYLDIISSLGKHIYYNTQINDMVTEILAFYYQLTISPAEKMPEDQFVLVSKLMICNIEEVCRIYQDDSYLKYKRAHYPLNVFNYLFYSLALTRDDGSAVVDVDARNRIQQAWLHVVENFLHSDLDKEYLTTPNVDLCITSNPENPICLYLDLVSRISDAASEDLLSQIWQTTLAVIEGFQINFVINFLKFSTVWLNEKPGSFRSNFALMLLSKTGSLLKASDLEEYADSKLNALQKANLLPDYFNYQGSSTSTVSESLIVDKGALLKMYQSHGAISQWLSYTNISPVSFEEPEVPLVARAPPTKLALGKALTSASLRFASGATGSMSSLLSALPLPSSRSRATSVGDISAANLSFQRSITSTRTRTNVRDLLSIASGMGPSANNSLLNDFTEDSIMSAPLILDDLSENIDEQVDGNVNGHVNGNVNGNLLSPEEAVSPLSPPRHLHDNIPRKKSGLAFCITNLDLESDDDTADNFTLDKTKAALKKTESTEFEGEL